jgi:hypothetical protein
MPNSKKLAAVVERGWRVCEQIALQDQRVFVTFFGKKVNEFEMIITLWLKSRG